MALSRREFVGTAAGLAGFQILRAARKPTNIHVKDVSFSYDDFLYRTPIKFGGHVVDRATILNVNCVVETLGGRMAEGFGSMPLGNVWSFPSATLSYETTLAAMKSLAEEAARITAACRESGHPIELNWLLEPDYLRAAVQVTARLRLAEPIPKLCTLVTASPFDAALHDAFGKVHGLSSYHTYGPEFMNHDLAYYLGSEYKGAFPSRYLRAEPKPRLPLYHLVSAIDPIEASDITKRVGDGLPETLPEWIAFNGLTHFKIKLNGDDKRWDVERVVRVDRVVTETERQRGVKQWVYSLDFNEKCPNVAYLLDFLREVKEKTPRGYARIQYVEQPTQRDLRAHPENVVGQAARLRPVVIDESLVDIESLLLAHRMGYSGAALKACKGQSHSILMASVAARHKFFLCVQDLTCPGASLIHSAGLAAHVPGVAAIEANARQFLPAANQGWDTRFPGIFQIHDGWMQTGALTGPGLGAVPPKRASESHPSRP